MSLSESLLGILHTRYVCTWVSCCWEFSMLRLIMYFVSLWFVCLLIYISACLHISAYERKWVAARDFHAWYVCTWAGCCWEFSMLRLIVYFICVIYYVLVVSHRCVSILQQITSAIYTLSVRYLHFALAGSSRYWSIWRPHVLVLSYISYLCVGCNVFYICTTATDLLTHTIW